ncbi:AMP-dependent synthetase and ligase [Allomuricauda ruestringensis DSM 13258]|uniref:AMP-dependent synthetase and ligase n=1 Tax=Allomuricauda ruestringensis (strain DSM 13258 / CIP 107369 / LMG 19739 / B1) TaxID=886377 RepID=G2PK17_ALLRU|nr:AMP-binding protein [Allomuricauda ruestringensis]AEM72002.1 AMP-dependent synthetase and ligase [Allomuricauda ruestringensis DSM 13258]
MEHPTWHNVHPDFRLNDIPLNFEGITKIGQNLIKEGKPFEKSIGDFLLDWASDDSTIKVQTSGSTGKPKTIVLKKEQMVNSALATGAYFKLEPRHKALLCLPCTGIAGKMMLVRAMILGLHLDYVEPSSTPLSNTNKTYDFVAMVPLQVQNSLKDLFKVKKLIIGGAPVDSNLRNKLKTLSVEAYETYGMTETITHIAVKRITGDSVNSFETLPHVFVTQDDRGCLVIDAPKISDQKVVTNDLVELISKTRFKWLGRYDSIINSGGIKLVPETIEEKLSSVIKSRFFVAGIPDETLGQKLVLVVEGNSTDGREQLQAIKESKTLSKYEVPKEVYFVKAFSETATKKINRQKTIQQIA